MMSPGAFGLTPDLIVLSFDEARYRHGYSDCHRCYFDFACLVAQATLTPSRPANRVFAGLRQVRRPSALRFLQSRERPERSMLPSRPCNHRRSRCDRLQCEWLLLPSNSSNTGTTYRCAGDTLPVPQRCGNACLAAPSSARTRRRTPMRACCHTGARRRARRCAARPPQVNHSPLAAILTGKSALVS